MNSVKKVLYIVIALLLIYILIITIQKLCSGEKTSEKTSSIVSLEPSNKNEPIDEPKEEIDKENINSIISEIPVTETISENISEKKPIAPIDTDFQDITNQEYISTQGEIILQDNIEDFVPVLSPDAEAESPTKVQVVEIMPEQKNDVANLDKYKLVINEKVEDIPITPKYFDSNSNTVMDGVKMMETELLSPWGRPYMLYYKNNQLLTNGSKDLDGASMRFTRKSPACCSPTYPPPFKINVDPTICKNLKDYVPSPYTGSDSWDNSGCACVTKNNIDFLATRGGNA